MEMIVTCNKTGLRLHVLDVYEKNGEPWLAVCKEHADPIMGRFGVRAASTSAIDLLVI